MIVRLKLRGKLARFVVRLVTLIGAPAIAIEKGVGFEAMDSLAIDHVPPPDPARFWDFTIDQVRAIAAGRPDVSLKLVELQSRRALFTMTFDGMRLTDWLNLDKPCVVLRLQNGEPAITLTLRVISETQAFLQVTAHPDLKVVTRQ